MPRANKKVYSEEEVAARETLMEIWEACARKRLSPEFSGIIKPVLSGKQFSYDKSVVNLCASSFTAIFSWAEPISVEVSIMFNSLGPKGSKVIIPLFAEIIRNGECANIFFGGRGKASKPVLRRCSNGKSHKPARVLKSGGRSNSQIIIVKGRS